MFLVQFLIALILLPLEHFCDDIFLVYMIRMLLLSCKQASDLAVLIAKSLPATLVLSTLPPKPVKHKQLVTLTMID
jgi:hypothetical protein